MCLADSATLVVREMLSSHEMLAAMSNNEIFCLFEILTDHEQLAAISSSETLTNREVLSIHEMLAAISIYEFLSAWNTHRPRIARCNFE